MSVEETIVRHCSPTLRGVKPASLVTIKIGDCGNCLSFLDSLNSLLNEKGIYFLPLRCNKSSVLVFVYNIFLLEKSLRNPSVKKYLADAGYSVSNGVGRTISDLTMRFLRSDDFPHEIGIFLGYPLDDVKGFIENNGENYKISGIWKVYGDEKKAKKLFKKYAECAKKCTEQYLNGKMLTIEQICKSA